LQGHGEELARVPRARTKGKMSGEMMKGDGHA
jgi:hypothetical protein